MRACQILKQGLALSLVLATLVLWPRAGRPYTLQYSEGGDTVRWHDSCCYYSVHQDGAPGLELEAVQEAIRLSFDQWEDVECSYFYFEETEPASCEEVGFFQEHGNVNLLIWRTEDWEEPADGLHKQNAMALTTVSYNEETGQILDADIEFNDDFFDFSLDGEEGLADIRNTATHEIGHLLGLEHTPDGTPSTMNPSALPGDKDKRTLSEDDEDGVCALYPLEEDPGTCKEPFCGLDLEGTSSSCKSTSCAETVCATPRSTPPPASRCSIGGAVGHSNGSRALFVAAMLLGSLF